MDNVPRREGRACSPAATSTAAAAADGGTYPPALSYVSPSRRRRSRCSLRPCCLVCDTFAHRDATINAHEQHSPGLSKPCLRYGAVQAEQSHTMRWWYATEYSAEVSSTHTQRTEERAHTHTHPFLQPCTVVVDATLAVSLSTEKPLTFSVFDWSALENPNSQLFAVGRCGKSGSPPRLTCSMKQMICSTLAVGSTRGEEENVSPSAR